MKSVLAVGAAVLALIWMGPFDGSGRGTIEVQHGIDGALLGQTRAQVERALGTPVHVVDRRNRIGRYRQLRYRGVTVMMQGRRHVTRIWTRSTEHRTDGGVGVGSTEEKVADTVRRIDCDPLGPATARCVLGDLERGRVVTVFFLRDDRVRRVTVRRVLR